MSQSGPAAEASPPTDGFGHVNAHTHLYSGLAPLGMPAATPAPESFVEILQRVWWRLDRALDEASLRAAAELYVAEALVAGTTLLVDHHESPGFVDGSLDVLADACQALGMRALLCYGATERNGGTDEAQRGLEECRRFIRANERPLVRGAVGLHASFTVSDATVRHAAALCCELDAVMHVHVAEDRADLADAHERGYAGPLERLLELEALPPGSIAAHGVHLSAAQVRKARDHDVWLVQNPRSNRGNRVGYPRALAESRLVALGTDGYPSRMDDELEALVTEAAAHGEPEPLAAARLAAGDRLAAGIFGAPFDPERRDATTDRCRLAGGQARDLRVAGRDVVRDGVLMTGDLAAIRARAQEQAARVWQRMATL